MQIHQKYSLDGQGGGRSVGSVRLGLANDSSDSGQPLRGYRERDEKSK
jgi:hypothetical protein